MTSLLEPARVASVPALIAGLRCVMAPNRFSMNSSSFEKRIEQIEARNKRVESDKAWETELDAEDINRSTHLSCGCCVPTFCCPHRTLA